jgi:Glycosyl hydrolases family 18
MNPPAKSVNAWIFLMEDEPPGTSYKTPGSCYQSLITYGVYKYTDMVSICWVDTVPTSSTTVPQGDGSTYTVELQAKIHPDKSTNLEYMQWLIQDARAVNPNVKILIMLGYAADEINRIFSPDKSQWQQNATDFANNLVAYLRQYDLDGFDVDWESPFSDDTNQAQFALLFTAIRAAFSAQSKYYYLTLSPANVGTLDAPTVNAAFDFVNLQLYSGFTSPSDFTNAGVSKDLLAYGAKFEPDGGVPYQDAQQAYSGYVAGGYAVATQWRLNSGDYQYEQAQQMILHQLVYGPSGASFGDAPIVGAAGDPPISQLVIRSGEVLDAIQATNSGTFEGNPVTYTLPQHGGNSGTEATVVIPEGDAVAEVSGYTGIWFGWNCVLQITITTRNGVVFGPYGNMGNASSKAPFRFTAPQGQSIVAFSGSIVNVPLAGGGTTDIIASLDVSYAQAG